MSDVGARYIVPSVWHRLQSVRLSRETACRRGVGLPRPFLRRRPAALALDTGEPEWSAYSSALDRKFLRLDEVLKPKDAAAEKSA